MKAGRDTPTSASSGMPSGLAIRSAAIAFGMFCSPIDCTSMLRARDSAMPPPVVASAAAPMPLPISLVTNPMTNGAPAPKAMPVVRSAGSTIAADVPPTVVPPSTRGMIAPAPWPPANPPVSSARATLGNRAGVARDSSGPTPAVPAISVPILPTVRPIALGSAPRRSVANCSISALRRALSSGVRSATPSSDKTGGSPNSVPPSRSASPAPRSTVEPMLPRPVTTPPATLRPICPK